MPIPKMSPLSILLVFVSLESAFAYYTHHFYMPSGEMYGPFVRFGQVLPAQERPFNQPQNPSADDQPGMVVVEAEESGREQKPEEVHPKQSISRPLAQSSQAIPRRTLRHLLAPEFGTGQLGPQYKRMRPCFYSPIQCLMKRSAA